MVIKQIRVGSKMSNSRVKGWSFADLGGVGGIHHPPPPYPWKIQTYEFYVEK